MWWKMQLCLSSQLFSHAHNIGWDSCFFSMAKMRGTRAPHCWVQTNIVAKLGIGALVIASADGAKKEMPCTRRSRCLTPSRVCQSLS